MDIFFLLMLVIKVTEVTTQQQKCLKMSTNSVKSFFFARRAKKASAEGRSPPQELEVNPRSGLYLLVPMIQGKNQGYGQSRENFELLFRQVSGATVPSYIYELTSAEFERNDESQLVVSRGGLDRDPPNQPMLVVQVSWREIISVCISCVTR